MELTRELQDRLKEDNPELRAIGIDRTTYAGPTACGTMRLPAAEAADTGCGAAASI
jgi:hypothetical protein